MGYRDYVWTVLEQEGVGVLNVDDLESAARAAWTEGEGWVRGVVWMAVVPVYVFCVTTWKARGVAVDNGTMERRSADLCKGSCMRHAVRARAQRLIADGAGIGILVAREDMDRRTCQHPRSRRVG